MHSSAILYLKLSRSYALYLVRQNDGCLGYCIKLHRFVHCFGNVSKQQNSSQAVSCILHN